MSHSHKWGYIMGWYSEHVLLCERECMSEYVSPSTTLHQYPLHYYYFYYYEAYYKYYCDAGGATAYYYYYTTPHLPPGQAPNYPSYIHEGWWAKQGR